MGHQRVEVRFEQERFGAKAEVCWKCSDPDAGVWVPVSFCGLAQVGMPDIGWPDAGVQVDVDLTFYTVPDAPSMWDEPPYDPMDRFDRWDVEWKGGRVRSMAPDC